MNSPLILALHRVFLPCLLNMYWSTYHHVASGYPVKNRASEPFWHLVQWHNDKIFCVLCEFQSGFGQLKATNDEIDNNSKWHINLKSTQPNISITTCFLSKSSNPPFRTHYGNWCENGNRGGAEGTATSPSSSGTGAMRRGSNSVVLGGSCHLGQGVFKLPRETMEKPHVFSAISRGYSSIYNIYRGICLRLFTKILWTSLDGTHFGGMAILNSLVGHIVG